MKRILLALGLSALTLVGGHFYNRRWDRAVSFFVALILWGIGVYLALTLRMSEMMNARGGDALSFFSFYWRIFLAGALALWIVGLIVTYADARRSIASFHWTPSGRLGAVGLSVLTGVLLLTQVFAFLAPLVMTRESGEEPNAEPTGYSYRDRHFSNYVFLGRGLDAPGKPAKPPSGEGYLNGRFVYANKPASGVTLSLALNGKYETDRLTTDENGVFTVRLPSGKWTIDRLVTYEWAGRPEAGQFMVVSGTEPKLTGDDYNEHYWFDREGTKIVVSEQPGEPQLRFTIRERVSLTWPSAHEKPTRGTLQESVVKWDPYPGAETYLVRVTELKREGRTTSFLPVSTKRVDRETAFALAGLAAVAGGEEKEYQASVLAFAADGTFLSQSHERFDNLTFVFTDKQQLVRDEERRMFSGSVNRDELDVLRDNERRIKAIEALLQDDLVDEAQKVFAKIKGKVDAGKKDAIAGYLMAKRGRCEEANKLFKRARSDGGRSCVPNYYRAGCNE